jgi:hypothetical protein
MSDMNDDDFESEIVAIKLTNGDLILGVNIGVDEYDSTLLQNPLVVSSVNGYLIMTDYSPFLSSDDTDPVIRINPMTMIYCEPVSVDIAAYYNLSVEYRKLVQPHVEGIISKSFEMIQKTVTDLKSEKEMELYDPIKEANHTQDPIKSVLDTPLADILGDIPLHKPEDSPDVIDFAAILKDAMAKKKKKDTLN